MILKFSELCLFCQTQNSGCLQYWLFLKGPWPKNKRGSSVLFLRWSSGNQCIKTVLPVSPVLYYWSYKLKIKVGDRSRRQPEGNPKAPFSIATTPMFKGGHYSFPWIAPLYPDTYLIMLSIKQGDIKYYFLTLWYNSTWDWTPVFWAIGEHSTTRSLELSSSCRAISTDIPDPLSPPLPIIHCFQQVLRATSRIGTELLYVRAGRLSFAHPCEGVHKSTSFMSSSLLLQQYPACLVRLILIVFVMCCKWPYSCCFVGCYTGK